MCFCSIPTTLFTGTIIRCRAGTGTSAYCSTDPGPPAYPGSHSCTYCNTDGSANTGTHLFTDSGTNLFTDPGTDVLTDSGSNLFTDRSPHTGTDNPAHGGADNNGYAPADRHAGRFAFKWL